MGGRKNKQIRWTPLLLNDGKDAKQQQQVGGAQQPAATKATPSSGNKKRAVVRAVRPSGNTKRAVVRNGAPPASPIPVYNWGITSYYTYTREQSIMPTCKIEEWITATCDALGEFLNPMPYRNKLVKLNGEKETFVFTEVCSRDGEDFKIMDNIAPRYWLPERIHHNFNIDTFWEWARSLEQREQPPFVDYEDYLDLQQDVSKPYWRLYDGRKAWYVDSLPQPEVVGIDEEQEQPRDTASRKADQGSERRIWLYLAQLYRQRVEWLAKQEAQDKLERDFDAYLAEKAEQAAIQEAKDAANALW